MKTITFEVEDSVFDDISVDGGVGAENETAKAQYLTRCAEETHNRAEKKRKEEQEAFVADLFLVAQKGTTEAKGAIENLKATIASEKEAIEVAQAKAVVESTPESVVTPDQT